MDLGSPDGRLVPSVSYVEVLIAGSGPFAVLTAHNGLIRKNLTFRVISL